LDEEGKQRLNPETRERIYSNRGGLYKKSFSVSRETQGGASSGNLEYMGNNL